MAKINLPDNYSKLKKTGGRPKNIVFSSALEDSIFNIITINNNKFPNNKTDINIAKKVVNRGLSLGGDTEAALTRLRNFLLKKSGLVFLRYTDDDDLIKK